MTPVVYTDKWAYVPLGIDGKRELYNLEKDPYGEKNIADSHPKIVTQLHTSLVGWLRELQAPAEAILPFE